MTRHFVLTMFGTAVVAWITLFIFYFNVGRSHPGGGSFLLGSALIAFIVWAARSVPEEK